MIYCSTCGKGIPDDSRFCTFCGSTVPVVDPDKPYVAKPSPATPPAERSTHSDRTATDKDQIRDKDVRRDETRRDDLRRDEVRRDEVRRDDVRRDDVRRDEIRRDEVRRDDVRRDDVRSDEVRREEIRREEIRRDSTIDQRTVRDVDNRRTTLVEDTAYVNSRNEYAKRIQFYENPGFYGALLLAIGFFLPWVNAPAGKMSAFQLLQGYLDDRNILMIILLVLLPLGALIILIQSLTSAMSGISGLFKWLAFLSLALIVVFFIMGIRELDPTNNWTGLNTASPDMSAVLRFIGIGFWLSLIGSILMLANRTYKRVGVIRETKI